ncbi:mercuric reductase [Salinispira pacifica]
MANNDMYDAVIIGSGQGGTPLASALAGKGLSTALVESRYVGGTCVNFGCTPTKTMVASARSAHMVARSGDFGVEAVPPPMADAGRTSPVANAAAAADSGAPKLPDGAVVDMMRVRERKRSIVASFREGSENRISSTENLTLIRGEAAFTGNRRGGGPSGGEAIELMVRTADGAAERRITAGRVFIDTGTRTAVPEIQGIESVPYLTNETIMELELVPRKLLIVGGGYIGVEFAQMFRRFGAEVTIVHRGRRLLSREDDDVSDAVSRLLEQEGVELMLGEAPERAGYDGSFSLSLAGGRTVEGSHLLLAAGRKANTEVLNPVSAGVGLDEKGFIAVNDRLETDAPNVWALGDVKGGPAFTHVSYDDYRLIMRNLYGDGNGSVRNRLVPYTIFTDPQLGRVGLSEKQASAAGRRFTTARIPMSYVARALEVDETEGFMKALVDEQSGQILGFAMLGMEAGEIAGAVQIAMMGGLSYPSLRDGMFAHPTLMESLNTLFGSV